jgi:iron complex outermembrane recepter protein
MLAECPPRCVMRGAAAKAALAVWAVLISLAAATSSFAQHVEDNPVISAEDAFGLTIGLESTGIYNPGMVRGFNPQTAGNARIDGLYFDQQGSLSQRVIEGSTIRVGISEIDYAFPAPTGIVDYDLRHATDGKPTATIIAELGPYDEKSISVDGSLPLYSSQLQLPIGVNVQTGTGPTTGSNLGYTANLVNFGAVPLWTPNDRVSVRLLIDRQDMSDARTLPTVFTAGNYLPPRIQRGFLGQYWALGEYITENLGGIINAKLSPHWSFATGMFRSIYDIPVSYADLFVNTEPNGIGEHMIVGFPDQRTTSNSGEVRLTGRFTDGPWLQRVVLMARGRDTQALYGGSDSVDVGTSYIGELLQVPKPDFIYGERTSDHTTLWSTGAAYRIERANWGIVSFGLQKEHYDKTVLTPGVGASRLTDDPARLYANTAVPIPGHAVLYGGYTQGFEDSGSAPSSAANRGAILPTARTWQFDGGIRYPLNAKLSLVAGVFELNKPYFDFDTHNVDRQLGEQRASGVELSIAGQVLPGLNVNAGALIGEVEIKGSGLAAEGVGPYALGQSHNEYIINLDYILPHLPAWSANLTMVHFSAVPAVVSDAYDEPEITTLNIGARYQFKLLGAPAMLRLQLVNALNAYFWNIFFSPGFSQFQPRTGLAYLTVDL